MVLEKSPVSPSRCPVAMAEAFGVVMLGNIEWLLWKSTPSRRISAMVGAVSSVTLAERRPSATKMITLCGRCSAMKTQPAMTATQRAARMTNGCEREGDMATLGKWTPTLADNCNGCSMDDRGGRVSGACVPAADLRTC